jgi:PhnB protein
MQACPEVRGQPFHTGAGWVIILPISGRPARTSRRKARIMATTINTYLNFKDTAKDAMDFYRSIFGGELQSTTFAEYQVSEDPAEQHKIMHARLTTDSGYVLMAADTPNSMEYTVPTGHSLSISGDDEAELRRYWEILAGTGTEVLPLTPSPWGDSFGMCVDRFGISWMINIAASAPGNTAGTTAGNTAAAAPATAPVDTTGEATGV